MSTTPGRMVVTVSVVSVVVAVVLLVLAAVWAATGVLGLAGRLKRNRWLGVRAEATMRSEEAFALANRVAGPGQIGAAVILVMGAVLTIGVDSAWSVTFGVVGLVAGLFVVGLVSALGVRAAQTLPAPDDTGCGCCSDSPEQSGTAGDNPAGDSPGADCGTASCGSCSLRGLCGNEPAQA